MSCDKKGFLVLTLSPHRGFKIGEDIYISVNKIKNDNEVSIAIRAPKDLVVRIDKKEKPKDQDPPSQ